MIVEHPMRETSTPAAVLTVPQYDGDPELDRLWSSTPSSRRARHADLADSLMRTRRLLALALGSLIVYVAVLFGSTVARGSAEVFPFFSWQLFAGVPAPIEQDYAVRLTMTDGRAVVPPVYFEDASAYLSTSQSITARALIQDLGRNIERKGPSKSAQTREVLESRYFQDLRGGRYQVVRRRYDIIERVDCRCFIEETVVAEFSLR